MTYLSTVLASTSHAATRRSGLASELPVVSTLLDWVRQRTLRRRTITALTGLSDAQLRDIGIDRADVASHVDEQFEALRRQ